MVAVKTHKLKLDSTYSFTTGRKVAVYATVSGEYIHAEVKPIPERDVTIDWLIENSLYRNKEDWSNFNFGD